MSQDDIKFKAQLQQEVICEGDLTEKFFKVVVKKKEIHDIFFTESAVRHSILSGKQKMLPARGRKISEAQLPKQEMISEPGLPQTSSEQKQTAVSFPVPPPIQQNSSPDIERKQSRSNTPTDLSFVNEHGSSAENGPGPQAPAEQKPPRTGPFPFLRRTSKSMSPAKVDWKNVSCLFTFAVLTVIVGQANGFLQIGGREAPDVARSQTKAGRKEDQTDV